MEINGKQYGIAYDQLTIVTICKELGLKYLDELQEVYKEAFSNSERVSIEAITLQYAIVYACLNRWCERNEKDYRISKNEVVDIPGDKLGEIIKEIFKFIAENSPESKEETTTKKKKEEPV